MEEELRILEILYAAVGVATVESRVVEGGDRVVLVHATLVAACVVLDVRSVPDGVTVDLELARIHPIGRERRR